MKSSAVPATLFCTALMLAPLCGGAGSAKATTAIAQQTGIVKGTVVDANGEAVIGGKTKCVKMNEAQNQWKAL